MAMLYIFILIHLYIASTTGEGVEQIDTTVCTYCDCRNTVVDCTNRKLRSIPRSTLIPVHTTILILRENLIADIPDNHFNLSKLMTLDLSNNKLTKLKVNSFAGLETLVRLHLQDNQIQSKDENYPIGVFRPLYNLIHLDLSSNIHGYDSQLTYPDMALSDLRSLKELKIDGLPELNLTEGFSHLRNLTSLNFTGNCKTTSIYNDSFKHVSQLSELVLSQCDIRYIGGASLGVFDQLHSLDLSFNENLGLENASMAMTSLKCSTFRILDLSGLYNIFAVGVTLTASFFIHLKHLNITDLYVDHNRFETIEIVAVPQIPKSLNLVSMRDNKPTFGLYLLSLNEMSNLTCLDSSQQFKSHHPSIHPFNKHKQVHSAIRQEQRTFCKNINNLPIPKSTTQIPKIGNPKFVLEKKNLFHEDNRLYFAPYVTSTTVISVPPKLRYMNCSLCDLNFPIPSFTFDAHNMLMLDLSQNVLNWWQGPILGVTTLQWLDLSNNFCDYVSEMFFNEFPNLRHLFIGSNFLSYVLEQNKNGSIFRELRNLETLDLSKNQIRDLPEILLLHQTQLKRLDLSGNIIRQFNLNIDHMHALEHIDLSSNILKSLPRSFRNFADRQFHKGRNLTVNLKGQIIQCSCDNMDFLKWMQTDTVTFDQRDEYRCEDNHGRVIRLSDLNQIILRLEKECASWTILTIVLISGALVLVIISIVGIVYRYRWKLRYFYYLARNKFRANNIYAGEQNLFEYDAFVSYADDDRGFVINNMIQKLEDEQGLKLCIHHRDFLVGEVIAANISNAVRTSKKTLIILTSDFLNSYWCNYELNMAKMEGISTGRNVLIVIMCENIPMNKLPSELASFVKNNSYIEYTDDPEGNIVFWDQLTRAINVD